MSNLTKELSSLTYSIYIFNWMLGLGIIEYPLGHPHPVLSFFYSLICVATYFTALIITYPTFIEILTLYENEMQVKIFLYTKIALTINTMVLGRYKSQEIGKCICTLTQADDLLEEIGIPKHYKKMMRAQLFKLSLAALTTVSIFVALLIIIFPETLPIDRKILIIYVFCYPVLLIFAANATFTSFVSYAKWNFKKLNDELKSFLTTTVDCPPHRRIKSIFELQEPIRRNYSYMIRTAKLAHLKLIQGCNEINDLYGLQILLSLAVAFTILTTEIYNTYTILTTDGIPHYYINKDISAMIVLINYYGGKFYILSWICSKCVEEAMEIGDIINQLYDEPSVNEDAQKEIRNFNIQLIQKPLKFTAYGFINIDYRLRTTLVATITTYLMILIQLSKDEKSSTPIK